MDYFNKYLKYFQKYKNQYGGNPIEIITANIEFLIQPIADKDIPRYVFPEPIASIEASPVSDELRMSSYNLASAPIINAESDALVASGELNREHAGIHAMGNYASDAALRELSSEKLVRWYIHNKLGVDIVTFGELMIDNIKDNLGNDIWFKNKKKIEGEYQTHKNIFSSCLIHTIIIDFAKKKFMGPYTEILNRLYSDKKLKEKINKAIQYVKLQTKTLLINEILLKNDEFKMLVHELGKADGKTLYTNGVTIFVENLLLQIPEINRFMRYYIRNIPREIYPRYLGDKLLVDFGVVHYRMKILQEKYTHMKSLSADYLIRLKYDAATIEYIKELSEKDWNIQIGIQGRIMDAVAYHLNRVSGAIVGGYLEWCMTTYNSDDSLKGPEVKEREEKAALGIHTY